MIFKTWLSDINKVAIAKDSLSGIRFDSKNASVVTAYTSAIKGLNEEQARYVLTKRYVSETDQADLLVKAQIISATEGVKASELSRQLVLQGLRKEQADALIEQISGNEAITSNTILTKEQTTAILEQAEARKLLSAEQRQNIANDIEESASSAAEATAEMAQASSELAESTAKVGTISSILARGVSQLGTGMKSLLSIFVSSPIAIITTLTGSIVGLTYIIGKFQDSAKNAAKAASDFASSMSSINSTYNQETQTLNELTEKYKDLREQLIEAKGNEEETYSIKSQMLELQKQLNEIYGDEYDKVNLVTDAYRDQTDELKENAKQKAENYLNENVDKIEEATKKMTSDYDYELGNFNYGLQDASIGNELHDQIKKLAEKNGIEWDDNKGFVFKGTAEEASKAINQFMTDVRGLRESEDGLSDGIIDNLKAFDSSMSNQLDIANKIIDGYQETYETAQLAQIASDTNLSKGYNQAIDAVEKYNDAVLRSENPYDDENVKKAWDNLQTIKNGIKENEAEWGQYSNIMDDVFSAASDDAYSFYQTMQSDDSVSKLVDDLQGLSDTDLQSMADDGMEDSFDKLCQKANEYGLEVQDVIDLLLQLGIVQGKVQDSVPDETDISSFSDAWQDLDNKEKDKLLELAKAGKLTNDTFKKTEGISKFIEQLKALGITAEEAIQKINKKVDSSDQLSAMSSQISKMSDMLADKKNGTTASASDLSGFDATVKGLDSWEKFEQVMGSSKSTMAQCQKAANALATEWVNSNNFLSQLNESNKDYYVTQLKNMGVDNAEAVVKNALAQVEQNEALQTEYATAAKSHNSDEKNRNNKVTTDLANATVSEIKQMAQEQAWSDNVTNSLIELALKKQLVNGTTIDFSGDLTNLYNYMKALGYACDALKTLNAIKSGADASYYPPEVLADMQQAAQSQVDKALSSIANTKNNQVTVNASGSSSYKGGGSSGRSGSGSTKSDSKQTIDWIDRKLTVLQNKIDTTKAKFENLFSLKSKNNNLVKQITTTKKLLSTAKKAADVYSKKASSYAKKSKLSKSLIKKVQSGSYNINDYDSSTAEKINTYKDLYDKAKDAKQQVEEVKKSLRELREERYQLYVDQADSKIDMLNAQADNTTSYKTKNKYLEQERKYIKQSYDYQIKIAKLNKDTTEQKKLQAEKQKELNELSKQEFDNISDYYDNRSKINSDKKQAHQDQMDLAEAKGIEIGSAFYKKQIGLNNSELERKQAEKEKLVESLKSIKKYSQEWYDARDAIFAVDSEIVNLQKDNVELQKSINQLNFDRFDKLLGKLSDVNEEADFLIELLSQDDLFNDNGRITDSGITTMGLNAEAYDVAMAQADKYADQIEELKKQFAGNVINQEEYDTQLEKCVSGQRDAIKSAISYKNAIVSLVEDGLNKERDALAENIDKQKELLESEKDLHDFQESLNDKNKTIADLTKQINALEGDDSEENRKKLQQLKAELADATQDRDDFLYDRSISDQEDVLDDMLKGFEDDMEAYLSDSDKVFADALAKANANSTTIAASMTDTAKKYGYTIQTDITKAWESAGTAVSEYSELFSQKAIGITSMINTITLSWQKACEAVEAYATATTKGTTANYDDNYSSNSVASTTSSNKSNFTTFTSVGISKSEIKEYITKHADKAKQKKSYYGALNRYLYEKTGGKVLSVSEEVQLAKMLGVSVKKDLSGTGDRQKILDALKKEKIAFANGGILGDLVKLTGEDGLFIGSAGESILTKEQTQALIDFRPAIPQLNTMVDFMKNVPISSASQSPTYNIEVSNNVSGAVSQETLNEMRKIATNQAETVIKKINNATYAKGVRR